MPEARPSRSIVCAWLISCSTVCVAWLPVALPFTFIASRALCQGPCSGPADWLALVTAAKKTSSIFSMFASASLSGFSVSETPPLTNCSSALRFASTACSSAESMPPSALPSRPSTSIAGAGLRAMPVDAASATFLTTFLMLSSVSSRPCSARSVASLTALRSASPCLLLASANMVIRASWSNPVLFMRELLVVVWRRRPAASLHVLAAVDGDVRSGHEGRLVRSQVDDQAGDFLGLAEASDRDLRQDLGVEDVLGDRRHHLRADIARRDRVDGHALLGDLEGECLAEAVHAGLGGGVVGLAERALGAIHRSDVDHATPVALDHPVGDLLGHVEQAVEVRAHDRVPAGLVHLLEGHVARD